MTDETNRLPDGHECTNDDGCTLPQFLSIDVNEGPAGLDYNIEVHRFTTREVAEVLVRLFDHVVASQAPDDMPRIVAHSRAREYLIQAAEQVPVSPETAVSLQDLLDRFVSEEDNGND